MLDFARCLLANPIASLAPKGKKTVARQPFDRTLPLLLSRPALGRLRRAACRRHHADRPDFPSGLTASGFPRVGIAAAGSAAV